MYYYLGVRRWDMIPERFRSIQRKSMYQYKIIDYLLLLLLLTYENTLLRLGFVQTLTERGVMQI